MTSVDRLLSRVIVVMLVVGFVYSGAATLRLSKEWWSKALPAEPDATIDETLSITGIRTGAELRQAVTKAGWGPHDEVLVLGATSRVSANDLTQIRFSASYLLYPRAVWADAWCDEPADSASCLDRAASTDALFAPRYRGAHHILLVSAANPFDDARAVRPVSDIVRLVDLK